VRRRAARIDEPAEKSPARKATTVAVDRCRPSERKAPRRGPPLGRSVHARRAAKLEARAGGGGERERGDERPHRRAGVAEPEVACCPSGRPPRPVTTIACRRRLERQPSCFSASSMTWVSSECSSR
jgi:hypothetical protein